MHVEGVLLHIADGVLVNGLQGHNAVVVGEHHALVGFIGIGGCAAVGALVGGAEAVFRGVDSGDRFADDLLHHGHVPVQSRPMGRGDPAEGQHQRFLALAHAVEAAPGDEHRQHQRAQQDNTAGLEFPFHGNLLSFPVGLRLERLYHSTM